MIRFATVLQSHWDWRAAGNFVLGGAGSSLLAWSALAALGGAVLLWPVLLALALVGAGLGCVWLEIGRPWRALNVFRHPQRSWMTREGLVATLTFALGLGAAATNAVALLIAAGIAGIGFLYCQARILTAAKGVPAWREPAIVPLIIVTGLAEGNALLALLAGAGGVRPAWLPWTLAALVLLRALVWRRYRDGLAATGAPAATQARLARIDPLPVGGGWVAAGLAVGAAFASTPAAAALLPLAGIAAVAGGWAMKFTIVTRAAHLQGYAFGRLRHGHPLGNGRAASQLPQRRSR
jgi:phenylacetyl-CoA:acceptor oxidoreductase subunit 2